jgi:hypothetical protein
VGRDPNEFDFEGVFNEDYLYFYEAILTTNDLVEAIAWWKEQKVPVWGGCSSLGSAE